MHSLVTELINWIRVVPVTDLGIEIYARAYAHRIDLSKHTTKELSEAALLSILNFLSEEGKTPRVIPLRNLLIHHRYALSIFSCPVLRPGKKDEYWMTLYIQVQKEFNKDIHPKTKRFGEWLREQGKFDVLAWLDREILPPRGKENP
jgi:hypothetical protein